jgi:hypothetical protein
MISAAQLNAVLHSGSRVTSHCFFNLRLCFRRLSKACGSLLRSESVILLVASLCAVAIDSTVACSSSAPYAELIWILGDINSEVKLRNRSQSLYLSTGSERFLVLIGSNKWKTICRWSESRISETMPYDSRTYFAQQYRACHDFPQESIEWDIVVVKFQSHLYAINSVVSLLWCCKRRYSKTDV